MRDFNVLKCAKMRDFNPLKYARMRDFNRLKYTNIEMSIAKVNTRKDTVRTHLCPVRLVYIGNKAASLRHNFAQTLDMHS